MSNYIGAAMTFVAGLAWNDAAKSALEEYVKQPDQGIRGKFAYAIVVTILSVVIIYTANRLSASYKPSLPTRIIDGETIKKLSTREVITNNAPATFVPRQ